VEGDVKSRITKKSLKLSKRNLIIAVAVFILLLIMPQFLSAYLNGVAVRVMIYILLVASMNIVNGYTGQFTVGQMGFANVGAYVTAIMMTNYEISFWIAVVVSGLAASLMGALVSYPARKLSGLYLAAVTLGFSEILRVIALNWISVTGGAMGIAGIPVPEIFGFRLSTPLSTFYMVFAFIVIMLICNYCVISSKVGRAWISIRENEEAAKSLGINTYRYKSLGFIYGGFWAGIAGAVMAVFYRFIDSNMFSMADNFDVLAMMIIGGQGTLFGPIVGSTLVIGSLEAFRFTAAYRGIIFGGVIIFMMWVRPQGILGKSTKDGPIKMFYNKLVSRSKANRKGGTA